MVSAFRNFQAVLAREQADVAALEAKMGRPLSEDERSRVGVSRLRLFLEQLLQHRYSNTTVQYTILYGDTVDCVVLCYICGRQQAATLPGAAASVHVPGQYYSVLYDTVVYCNMSYFAVLQLILEQLLQHRYCLLY